MTTDDNIQQSIDRSGGKFGNKGADSAEAALKMIINNVIGLVYWLVVRIRHADLTPSNSY